MKLFNLADNNLLCNGSAWLFTERYGIRKEYLKHFLDLIHAETRKMLNKPFCFRNGEEFDTEIERLEEHLDNVASVKDMEEVQIKSAFTIIARSSPQLFDGTDAIRVLQFSNGKIVVLNEDFAGLLDAGTTVTAHTEIRFRDSESPLLLWCPGRVPEIILVLMGRSMPKTLLKELANTLCATPPEALQKIFNERDPETIFK